MNDKIKPQHLARKAILYIRQSSAYQVTHNLESQKLQYAMQERLHRLGWTEIEVVDEDLGRSASGAVARAGFERMVAEVCLGKVGAPAAREVSRFARNSREWQQLVEVCRVVDTVLIDQEAVYLPRQGNVRLLLGLKGSLNEYELDLLRQRSLEARQAKAKRGELLVAAPVGYLKTDEHRLEKDPDQRVQQAVLMVFRKVIELSSVRQALLWFLEHGLQLLAQAPDGAICWKRPTYGAIYRMLTNPIYGGAYAYGKSQAITHYADGEQRHGQRRKPRSEWSVLIPNAHEGSWGATIIVAGALTHLFCYRDTAVASHKMLPIWMASGSEMTRQLSMKTRNELIDAIRIRYQGASKADKAKILDELTELTGYHRKHAIRVLQQTPDSLLPHSTPRTRHRQYDEQVRQTLILLWEAGDRICGKRLKVLIPILLQSMENHGHLSLEPGLRSKLLAISAATID